MIEHGLPAGTMLNVNVPRRARTGRPSPGWASGSTATGWSWRPTREGRRRYRIYGDDASYHDEPGTDFRAIAEGKIAVTPIHLDLTSSTAIEAIEGWRLGR